MRNNIRSTNLRFNLEKDLQRNHAATIVSWARQDHPPARQRNYESEEYETL